MVEGLAGAVGKSVTEVERVWVDVVVDTGGDSWYKAAISEGTHVL